VAEAWKVMVRQLARAVRERRLSLDLSQADLAQRSRVSLRRIQNIEAESDISNPSLRILVQVAEALKTTVPALLDADRSRTKSGSSIGKSS
jgi:transcriptional regulator with XRE-family HTH domain